jgi:response regulator of citrate/malate metabolism
MAERAGACRILVVDDDRMQNEIISVYLAKIRAELIVDYALTIEEAITFIAANTPDIIFLDNRIPPDIDFRNGIERIRQAGYGGPVIVQSVAVDDPVLDNAGAHGVIRVVDKFDLREDMLGELVAVYCSSASRANGNTLEPRSILA